MLQMKITDLQPGQIVYDCHRTKLGNTTMSSMGIWEVRIVSVDLENNRVEASWNGNRPQWRYESSWKKWRKVRPVLVGSLIKRIATRAELKAMEAQKHQ